MKVFKSIIKGDNQVSNVGDGNTVCIQKTSGFGSFNWMNIGSRKNKSTAIMNDLKVKYDQKNGEVKMKGPTGTKIYFNGVELT